MGSSWAAKAGSARPLLEPFGEHQCEIQVAGAMGNRRGGNRAPLIEQHAVGDARVPLPIHQGSSATRAQDSTATLGSHRPPELAETLAADSELPKPLAEDLCVASLTGRQRSAQGLSTRDGPKS